MSPSGHLHEMFSSVQGEGLYIGYRQLFLRFSGCNLRCRYCDTPESQQRHRTCRVQKRINSMAFQTLDNPVPVEEAVSRLLSLDLSLHHAVSFTGGEPLLQVAFLKETARRLKEHNASIFLETNGTLPDQLQDCQDLIDIIAMDWKLPSSTGQKDCTAEHIRFLRQRGGTRLFVKVIVTAETPVTEIETVCLSVAGESVEIPLILQPVSDSGRVKPPTLERLLAFHARAQGYLRTVRVLPQMHKLMKIP